MGASFAAETGTADFDAAISGARPYLLRFARQRLRDAALVEDVVQDTLLAALQGGARFEQRASVRTWLTGILLHKIADSVRRQQRDARPEAIDADGNDDDVSVDEPENGHGHESIEWRDPQRMLESRQLVELLGHGLRNLTPIASRALTLREIEGLSTSEVARELGLQPAQCAVLLHRARARLRQSVQQRWESRAA